MKKNLWTFFNLTLISLSHSHIHFSYKKTQNCQKIMKNVFNQKLSSYSGSTSKFTPRWNFWRPPYEWDPLYGRERGKNMSLRDRGGAPATYPDCWSYPTVRGSVHLRENGHHDVDYGVKMGIEFEYDCRLQIKYDF